MGLEGQWHGAPNLDGETLARLREVAVSANDADRCWAWEGLGEHGYPQRVTRMGDVVLVAECFEGQVDEPARFAEHIATFDPPMVVALLDELIELRKGRS
jgi:hypothetical protein